MIGILLAAGTSRRLGAFTEDRPKCLIDVGGKEMLGRQLEQLAENKVTKIYIAVGFMKDKIIHYCQTKYPHLTIKFVESVNWYESNNAKSLELALEKIIMNTSVGEEEDILVMNADVVCYKDLIKELIQCGLCENVLAYQRKKELPDEDMKLRVDEMGNVVDIGKMITKGTGEFTGIAKFGKATIPYLLKNLERCGENDWFETALLLWIMDEDTSKPCLGAVDLSHYPFMEIDFPADLELANDIFPYADPVWEQGGLHKLLAQDRRNLDDALALMVDFRGVLIRNNIRYWLNWGLLLGAVREGKPLKWDTDIDICIDKENEELLWTKVVPAMKKLRCFVPDKNLHCDNDCFIIRDHERIECNMVEKLDTKSVYSPGRCNLYCPSHYLDKLDTIKMMGELFSVPNNAEAFLTGWYGDWRTPSATKPSSF